MGALILGALGSGLWEKVLSPLLSFASSAIVETVSRFSKSYQDSIYALAAKGSTSSDALIAGLIIMTFLFMGVIILITPSIRRGFGIILSIAEKPGKVRLVVNIHTFLCFAIVFTAMLGISKLEVATGIERKTLRSVEILRPMIGEKDYIQFRSEFYSMSTKDDYLHLKVQLDEKAKLYKARIPLDY